MRRIFTASRWSSNNLLFPNRIEIEDDVVRCYKGAIIGYNSITIPRVSIASVRILSNIIFADIVIESFGGKEVISNGFRKSVAREIYELLENEYVIDYHP